MLAALLCSLLPAGARAAAGSEPATPPATVLRAKRLHPSPEGPPIDDAVVLMRGGRITAVGPRGTVALPPDARELPCAGGTVTAGFQNSHVHFTAPPFQRAAQQDRAALEAGLAAMLTRHGFTTVVDTASDPRDTLWLRERIARGELRGPRILSAGAGLYRPSTWPACPRWCASSCRSRRRPRPRAQWCKPSSMPARRPPSSSSRRRKATAACG